MIIFNQQTTESIHLLRRIKNSSVFEERAHRHQKYEPTGPLPYFEVVKEIRGQLNGAEFRIAVVVSRWNELVTKELLAGALDELSGMGVSNVETISVPGTWEIPVAAQGLLRRKENCVNAIVALGCIMQGETAHAQLLGGDVSGALMGLQISSGIPIAWGILTPVTLDQALDRAGVKQGNKGREAAHAAVEMASLLRQL